MTSLMDATRPFTVESCRERYSYRFSWLGAQVIQYPQDLMALQEILWATQATCVLETGTAHGGLTLFLASMMNLIHGEARPYRIVTIEKGIRPDLLANLQAHDYLREHIVLIEGDSVAADIRDRVFRLCHGFSRCLIVLDSNHSQNHVEAELEAYRLLAAPGDYIVVCDTIIDHMPAGTFSWGDYRPGSGPGAAVATFLSEHPEFTVDRGIDDRILISANPGGYLRRLPA